MMKFYHGTSKENWEKIQKEGVLWGRRGLPSRCTYLAIDIENAVAHRKPNEVVLEVDYDPTGKGWVNNYFPDEWQHREYEPIPLSKVKIVSHKDRSGEQEMNKPDEVLFNDIEMPRRWCPLCDTYRLFSTDATFCLSCGAYRHDEFKPVNWVDKSETV